MRPILRFCAIAMALLWMPSTVHCSLERLGVLEDSAACETHPESCSEQEGRCGHDTCELVENGRFTFSFQFLAILPAAETFEPWRPDRVLVAVERGDWPRWHGEDDDPLNWIQTWQFSRRTALPARAPDDVA